MTKPLLRWYNLNPDKTVTLLPEGQYTDYNDTRKVANDTIDAAMVSTVFLGMDHNMYLEQGEPVLFETMIFGGEYDDFQCRYCTYDQALKGHEKIVHSLKNGTNPYDIV